MTVWAIVPVKPLRRGKSRLSVVLDEDDRQALNHCLLENTLVTLKSIAQIEHVLVVSRDPQALSLARSLQARTIQEAGAPHLNQALERATIFARRHAVSAVLVVPADLPLINTLDIEAVLEMGKNPPVVVISPDRHRLGTNALLISPPDLLQFQFGADSFQKHSSQALQVGARLEICDRPAIALDLDLPEDLSLVRRQMQMLDALLVEGLPISIGDGEVGTNGSKEKTNQPCADHIEAIGSGGQDAE